MDVISIPSGWDLNPSSYRARMPVVILSILGIIVTLGEARSSANFLAFALILTTAIPGGKKRWARQPWLAILHAFMASGGILITLSAIWPWVEGRSSLLLSEIALAVVGTLIAGPALDEALAALQFVKRSHRRPLWRALLGLTRSRTLSVDSRGNL